MTQCNTHTTQHSKRDDSVIVAVDDQEEEFDREEKFDQEEKLDQEEEGWKEIEKVIETA